MSVRSRDQMQAGFPDADESASQAIRQRVANNTEEQQRIDREFANQQLFFAEIRHNIQYFASCTDCALLYTELKNIKNDLILRYPVDGLYKIEKFLGTISNAMQQINPMINKEIEVLPIVYVELIVKNCEMFVDQFTSLQPYEFSTASTSEVPASENYKNTFDLTRRDSVSSRLRDLLINHLKPSADNIKDRSPGAFKDNLPEFIRDLRAFLELAAHLLRLWDYMFTNRLFKNSTYKGMLGTLRKTMYNQRQGSNIDELRPSTLYCKVISDTDGLISKDQIYSYINENCSIVISTHAEGPDSSQLHKCKCEDFDSVNTGNMQNIEVSGSDVLKLLKDRRQIISDEPVTMINVTSKAQAVFHIIIVNENTVSKLKQDIDNYLRSTVRQSPYSDNNTYLLIVVNKLYRNYDFAQLNILYSFYEDMLSKKGCYRGIYFMAAKKVNDDTIKNAFEWSETANNKYRIQGLKYSYIQNLSIYFNEFTYHKDVKIMMNENEEAYIQHPIKNTMSVLGNTAMTALAVGLSMVPVTANIATSEELNIAFQAAVLGAQVVIGAKAMSHVPNLVKNSFDKVKRETGKLRRFVERISSSSSQGPIIPNGNSRVPVETQTFVNLSTWPTNPTYLFRGQEAARNAVQQS